MTLDWIAFLDNGHTVIDFVITDCVDAAYPYRPYSLTPHYGRVDHFRVIERRSPTEDTDAK